MKLVVCDDDATLRSVVSRLAEGAGHQVMAETDNATDAVELIVRFGADALVLDLSLPWGSGMEAIHQLRRQGSDCQIVVFTAYADETPELEHLGLRAVIDKPDFEALEQVLTELATGVSGTLPGAAERRKPWRSRPEVPAASASSPSGLEDPASFERVLDVLGAGDAVLAVHVAGIDDDSGDEFSQLLRADRFLAVCRSLRIVLRTPDRMTVDGDEIVALLLDGGRAGVEAAFRRLERHHEISSLPGVICGGWAVHDGVLPPFSTYGRARDAARRSIGQPPGDRLWAG
jgi:CheY-like chemotaxis protein